MELEYRAAHERALIAIITQLPVLKLAGADVVRYLHGRITQDVKGLKLGDVTKSLLLSPQGRVLGHFSLARIPSAPSETGASSEQDEFIIVGDNPDTNSANNFIDELMRFKVADRVEVTQLHLTHSLLTIQGPQSRDILAATFHDQLPSAPFSTCRLAWKNCQLIILQSSRIRDCKAPSYDILVDTAHAGLLLNALEAAGAARGTEENFELLRIEAGIPRYGVDISESIIAPELELTNLVSFSKGCYAGQEVVEMATARGRPNRRLILGELPLTAGLSIPAVGTAIILPNSTNEAEQKVGEVRSVALLPWQSRILMLALIKTTHLQDPLTVNGHPFRPGSLPFES